MNDGINDKTNAPRIDLATSGACRLYIDICGKAKASSLENQRANVYNCVVPLKNPTGTDMTKSIAYLTMIATIGFRYSSYVGTLINLI